MKRVDLIWLSGSQKIPDWTLGNVLNKSNRIVVTKAILLLHLEYASALNQARFCNRT
jgi:hypothetical protein